ncbi:MAG: response regulator [Bacteroidota bacterium]|nr:response regulator [Bacteroidota bacterium]
MPIEKHILYVDDEPINLELFKLNFRKHFNIHTAASGTDGLRILGQNKNIYVIVSDMKMPEMNGIEFIKKAKTKFPGKKFFILTGFEITQEIQDAINSNLIVKYLRKPFKHDDILEIIQNTFKSIE